MGGSSMGQVGRWEREGDGRERETGQVGDGIKTVTGQRG
jgi:hypothetical protein